jgi:hypothetical protein
MTYHVRPSRVADPKNRFEFDLPNGKSYSIPKMQFLKPTVAFAVQENAMTGMKVLFEEYMPEVLEQLDDNEQLIDLFKAWEAASSGPDGTVSLGESVASAVS